VPEPRRWWWELRPHPAYGTLEVRVPDAQATVRTRRVTAVIHALTAHLADRFDAGEPLATADTWRLEENRWSAARDGMEAELADLQTGERVPARDCLDALITELTPPRSGSAARRAARRRRLAGANGAARQRAAAARRGREVAR
jgi:carboxylate-amine ligase